MSIRSALVIKCRRIKFHQVAFVDRLVSACINSRGNVKDRHGECIASLSTAIVSHGHGHRVASVVGIHMTARDCVQILVHNTRLSRAAITPVNDGRMGIS